MLGSFCQKRSLWETLAHGLHKYARMFYHQLDSNPTGAGLQATSRKRQAASVKQQAMQGSSYKQQASSRVGSKAL